MLMRRLATASLFAWLAAPATPAQVAGFTLTEINAAPGPLDPGVPYTFLPSGLLEVEAAGISVADVNDDSFLDMLLCGTEGRPNEFYLNNGNGTFTESAAAFGIDETSRRRGNSVFFDIDNDGDLDLLTCGYPGDVTINLDLYSLYRNDGAGAGYTFTEITSTCGGFALAPTAETTVIGIPGGATVGDYNNDGFLDVLVSYWYKNNATIGYNRDQFRLWKNVANPEPDLGQPDYTSRLLEDATLEAGLDGAAQGQVWMPSFIDVNRDGKLDLHINVETAADELRLNLGNGTFGPNIATSVGMNFNAVGPANWGNEMGIAIADYDNDGDLDTYQTNSGIGSGFPIKADAFYRNDSDFAIGGLGVKFTHIGPVMGVGTDSTMGVGWGAAFVDLDNDGDKDLINVRGLGSFGAVNYIWTNKYPVLASDNKSVSMQAISGSSPQFSGVGGTLDTARSLVAFDFDNDGDLDVATTRSQSAPPGPGANMRAGFFLNTLATANPSLQVSLEETGGSLATVGARVSVRTGGTAGVVQLGEVRTGSSFLAQEPARLHFGLGAASGADWIAIRWFDGTQQVVTPSGPPLAGFVGVTRTGVDATGDLDGDGLTNDADLALVVKALKHKADVDALVPSWPWQLTADADGNGLFDTRDYALLRKKVRGSFASLGNAHPGTHGEPTLSGSGPLTPSSIATFTLANALENTNWWMVYGLGVNGGNFKGGIMVPSTNFFLGPLPTGPTGGIAIPALWPALPPGLTLEFQVWLSDPAASKGFAASNGLSALVP
jgi:enediyne biosynthesis protein E4